MRKLEYNLAPCQPQLSFRTSCPCHNSCPILTGVVVVLPLKGVSMLDSPGGQFWDPAADQACYDAIKTNLKPGIPVVELDFNINDPEFADKCAALMLEMLK